MKLPEVEQTLILIKPDALKNSMTGYILTQLSEYHTGLLISASKIVHVNNMLAGEHYYEHKSKGFFKSLLAYIHGTQHFPNERHKQRVEAFVYQGDNVIKKIRDLAGPTNPHEARTNKPGCIRSLGTVVEHYDENKNKIGMDIDNLIHASANEEDARREIKLWFMPSDFPPLLRAYETSVCCEHFYYKNGKLYDKYIADSYCLVAPGDILWKTDLEALNAHIQNKPAETPLDTVAAKYLINMM